MLQYKYQHNSPSIILTVCRASGVNLYTLYRLPVLFNSHSLIEAILNCFTSFLIRQTPEILLYPEIHVIKMENALKMSPHFDILLLPDIRAVTAGFPARMLTWILLIPGAKW